MPLLPRTGLPIPAALEAVALNRTTPLRRLAEAPTAVIQIGGSRFTELADIPVPNTRTLLRPADHHRVALVPTNNDAAVNVRIGGQGVGPAQGVRLFASSSMRVTSRAEIYAISEGATVTLSMTEEAI